MIEITASNDGSAAPGLVQVVEGEPRVSSLEIASRTENEHRAVLQLVRGYESDLEALGHLAFEMRDRPGVPGPALQVAHLNEQQATLLITYMRNSDIVRAFKLELVKQFYAMRQTLSAPRPVAQLDRRQLALLVLEAEDAREAAEQKAAELAPRADAWDELASASGDYAVADAAKMLQRAGIDMGRDRLFDYMGEIGWVYRQSGRWQARQSAVDAGRLRHKPQSHNHPETGRRVIDSPQVRVTIKGIERLRVMLLEPIAELAAS